jgi:hypothetical protein
MCMYMHKVCVCTYIRHSRNDLRGEVKNGPLRAILQEPAPPTYQVAYLVQKLDGIVDIRGLLGQRRIRHLDQLVELRLSVQTG